MRRRHTQQEKEAPRVDEAQARLEETQQRWHVVHALVAALRTERELNHFAANIEKTMQRRRA